MPPPRPESQEVEDSSEDSDSSSEEEEAAPANAAAPNANANSAEVAASRAAALAEQLAARTAITAIAKAAPSPEAREAREGGPNGSASPFARPRETGPSVDVEPLILEAEPQDLVVIGNADCSSWIGKAIADSQFVAVVKTPVAPSTSVIVDWKLAEEAAWLYLVRPSFLRVPEFSANEALPFCPSPL